MESSIKLCKRFKKKEVEEDIKIHAEYKQNDVKIYCKNTFEGGSFLKGIENMGK